MAELLIAEGDITILEALAHSEGLKENGAGESSREIDNALLNSQGDAPGEHTTPTCNKQQRQTGIMHQIGAWFQKIFQNHPLN